jgi:hypothetical protein
MLLEATEGPDDIYCGGVFCKAYRRQRKLQTNARTDQEIQQYCMDISPGLTMHIRNIIYAQMPYGGDIIRHDALTNDESGVNTSAND